jgi:HEAT repeat protein
MKIQPTKVALLILATVALIVILFSRTQKDKRRPTTQPQPVAKHQIGSLDVSTPVQGFNPAATITNTTLQTPVTNRAQTIVGILKYTRPGRLTTGEAHQLVTELIGLAEFDQAIRPLLTSEAVPDRLLAAYAILEKTGFTEEMRGLALSDPSPYVRSEIAIWLFRKQDFASLDSLVDAIITSLSPTSIDAMVALAAASPRADVPMALSRLDIGEGLPRYLTIVAEHSTNVIARVFESLSESQTPDAGKKLMLQILAVARPLNYDVLLQRRLALEPILSTRTLVAQHLAATISETNADARARIASLLPQPLPGLEPVALEFRETRLARLRELEQILHETCHLDKPDSLRIHSALAAYLHNGHLLGSGSLSAATLKDVIDAAANKTIRLPDEDLAEALFETRRIQKTTGAPHPIP